MFITEQKKEAEIAAAGRAMDCILHRENVAKLKFGEGNNTQRYCFEEPYLVDEAPVSWKFISESVNEVVDVRDHAKRRFELRVKWKEVPPCNRVPVTSIYDLDYVDNDTAAYREMRRAKISSSH